MIRKIINVVLTSILGTALYLLLSIHFNLPFPQWYEKMVKEEVDSSMAHDPFLNLAKTTIKFREERDSLQHIVDSLKINKFDSLKNK